ncbi:hypothetical protein BHYA_0074g00300 [Botrytis hyacinthi]|uniref:Uncharacterized protein n=1 Tax=Botrytis hyacinthi TaxID=278943 RepID=A0A4Z1GU69_9HELO|nr:hypothetical protein BHYA_0074g00300 [Botrytis hyacinthi]
MANPTDILNQTARVFTNAHNIKRDTIVGALAALAERLRRCPGSVVESNYDERVIRQDLKRRIAEKEAGIQEVRSLNRRSHGAMVKSMVIGAEIMDFILETKKSRNYQYSWLKE